LDQQPQSQQGAIPLLLQSGLATAGWITLAWLQQLTGYRVEMMDEIAPGNIRRRYLKQWLKEDLANRLPAAITQLGFTLTAHDTVKDALQAARLARHHRSQGERHLKLLQQELGTAKPEAR
jgi:hypothetical protein